MELAGPLAEQVSLPRITLIRRAFHAGNTNAVVIYAVKGRTRCSAGHIPRNGTENKPTAFFSVDLWSSNRSVKVSKT